jgi:hypothetical protein
VYAPDSVDNYIQSIQLFRYHKETIDSNSYILLPNTQGINEDTNKIKDLGIDVEIKTNYFYYHKDESGNIIEDYKGEKNDNFIPYWVENYGKLRSITAKETNRFNLL